MHCHYLHWMDPRHQSQRVVIFFPVTRCDALSLFSLDGSRRPVSESCYHFPCHPLHCHYLHWMDPGHQSQRDAIFFSVTRCTVIIFIGWIPDTTLKELSSFSLSLDAQSLASLDGSRTPVSKSCYLFLFTWCTVIISTGWIPDTSLKELLPFSMSPVALSLSSLDGSRTPVSMSCYLFPCHPMLCHYLHWMDPGH